ncbi:hypothetical protein [Acinetobacter gerneri]|uniref:hypothetical protein n=1 Tax=Acinetobacter gerneri TaxID=202952 RepID=UPI003213689F
MKNFKLFLILFFSLSLIACEKKTLYFTPEATGYIYDSVTKKPINNLTANVGFDGLTAIKDSQIKLESGGKFTLLPVVKEFYIFSPNTQKYNDIPPYIYIGVQPYSPKVIDYSEFSWKQLPANLSGTYNYRKINLGIIYLDPEKP